MLQQLLLCPVLWLVSSKTACFQIPSQIPSFFRINFHTTAVTSLYWHQIIVPSNLLIKMALKTLQKSSNHQNWNSKQCPYSFWRVGGTQAEKSAKFGQNGLCMLAGISKSASLLISIVMIWTFSKVPKTILTNDLLGTLIWCQYKLATAVLHRDFNKVGI